MTQTNKTKKILKTAVYCVSAVLLCAVLYSAVFTAVVKIKNPHGVAMPFGFGASFVLSGSMEPEISTDDLVFVKKPGELHVGEVVLYNTGNSNVLHRITHIDGDTLITRGDANNTDDKPISSSAVIGVYFGKIPGGGKIVRFVTSPPFVMAVVFLLMAVTITWMFVEEHNRRKKLDSLRAEIEKIKAENDELRKNRKK